MDLHSLFETLRSYAPPYFFGTLVAGAFGAFAGAWAAGRVHTKRAIVAELNSISAALALCFSIRGLFIGLKKQHVRPLRDRFEQAKHEFQEATKGRKGPVIYTLLTDFQTMTPVRAPTEALERHVFEKISLRGRALVAAVTLVGAIDGLDKSIKYRNDLIAE